MKIQWIDKKTSLKAGKKLFLAGEFVPAELLTERRIKFFKDSQQIEYVFSGEELAKAEKVEAEKVEAERIEAEKVEAERIEAEKVEAERIEAEKVEAERIEAERIEAERIDKKKNKEGKK